MKHSIAFTFGLLCTLLFLSCREKHPSQSEDLGLPTFVFTNEDSMTIKGLAEQYIENFKSGDYDRVVHLLHIVRNDSILPLPDSQSEQFKNVMRMLPIVDCALKELSLYSDRDNELRIALQISEQGNLSTGEGCINLFLNPIEKDGQWYLTLRDEYAEGVGVYH